jgi:hypothetical protein
LDQATGGSSNAQLDPGSPEVNKPAGISQVVFHTSEQQQQQQHDEHMSASASSKLGGQFVALGLEGLLASTSAEDAQQGQHQHPSQLQQQAQLSALMTATDCQVHFLAASSCSADSVGEAGDEPIASVISQLGQVGGTAGGLAAGSITGSSAAPTAAAAAAAAAGKGKKKTSKLRVGYGKLAESDGGVDLSALHHHEAAGSTSSTAVALAAAQHVMVLSRSSSSTSSSKTFEPLVPYPAPPQIACQQTHVLQHASSGAVSHNAVGLVSTISDSGSVAAAAAAAAGTAGTAAASGLSSLAAAALAAAAAVVGLSSHSNTTVAAHAADEPTLGSGKSSSAAAAANAAEAAAADQQQTQLTRRVSNVAPAAAYSSLADSFMATAVPLEGTSAAAAAAAGLPAVELTSATVSRSDDDTCSTSTLQPSVEGLGQYLDELDSTHLNSEKAELARGYVEHVLQALTQQVGDAHHAAWPGGPAAACCFTLESSWREYSKIFTGIHHLILTAMTGEYSKSGCGVKGQSLVGQGRSVDRV